MAYTGHDNGILSDQIKFYMADKPSTSGWQATKANIQSVFHPASPTTFGGAQVKNLQSIPSLGGSTNKVDITCLEDTARRYMNGLKDYGESIDFKFLYDNTATGNYVQLGGLNSLADTDKLFAVQFKDNDTFYFMAAPSVAIDDVAVDSALTFTASMALKTDIFYAQESAPIGE